MQAFPFVVFAGLFAGVVASPVGAAGIEGRIRAGAGIEQPPALSVAVDAWACAPDGVLEDPRLRIGSDRGVADVVVRIAGADGAPRRAADGEVVLDQKGCVFRPHVVIVAPGQDLVVRNSDPVLHNFRTLARKNRTINRAQVKGKEDRLRFSEPEIIPVECDVHYWMSAVVVVAEDAWTAVTAADGTFRLPDVPPGAYDVELWHQRLGTQTLHVEVGESGGRVDFEWPAPPAPAEGPGAG